MGHEEQRTRFSPLVAVLAALLVTAVHAGCGAPDDPGPPEAPDGGVTVDGASSCFGVADGVPCAGTKLCVRGVCSDPSCGDGIVTAPEECDRGALNGPGSGCETTCKHSCLSTDAARNCSAQDSCAATGSCDDTTHTCKLGGPK